MIFCSFSPSYSFLLFYRVLYIYVNLVKVPSAKADTLGPLLSTVALAGGWTGPRLPAKTYGHSQSWLVASTHHTSSQADQKLSL